MQLRASWSRYTKVSAICLLVAAAMDPGGVMLAGAAPTAGRTGKAAAPAGATTAPEVASGVSAAADASGATAPVIAPVPGTSQRTVTFAQLGQTNGLRLRGTEGSGDVNFGIRLDQSVASALLRLRYAYSPALIPDLSQLKVYLNEELIATLPFNKQDGGKNLVRDIPLDARMLSGFNRVRLVLIGHYTMECEDQMHSSLWADISPQSEIITSTQPLTLRNDLSTLPAPFFDRHDNRDQTVPFVFGAPPSLAVVHAAGVVATWAGAIGDYRRTRFPVSVNAFPSRHGIAFVTNDTMLPGLDLPKVDAPTLRMVSNPNDPSLKLLVIQGRDAKDLETAALALVSGRAALSGDATRIAELKQLPPRPAYDAPRWVRTDRPVKLGELVDNPSDLQANGYMPWPIRIQLNLPADLLTWQNTGVPMDLKYRYTPPVKPDDSSMSVSINDQFVRAYRLRSAGASSDKSHMLVELLSDGTMADRKEVRIPAFQVASRNSLSFQFAMEPHKEGMCSQTITNAARSAIDADSTIDFSELPHYAELPNLSFFAGSGFPFTKYADLAQTAVVMSKTPDKAELETVFSALGQFGRSTGVYADRFEVLDTTQTDRFKDRDLLVVGGKDAADLLTKWGKNLPLVIDQTRRVMQAEPQGYRGDGATGSALAASRIGPQRMDAVSQGPLAALVGFESPVSSSRSVVAINASSDDGLLSVVDAIDTQANAIHGDLAVVNGASTASYRLGKTYFVGDVSWWTRIRYHLSSYPILVGLVALLAAFAIALKCFGWLQRRAARRLEK
ncbi:cellulose biosynthesis cyclic di-GMP-binding regulatory protein BcsB [Pandoraea sputorum]|uniref:cellulose biosynthesis cyclic di-GMP-binding regulatory protein BcsB n=1 Tax=Pandoraea sputorum TaxID=93222 RepID=UPI002B2CF8D0|nr:cellulose biosynthesis cyclic di-GMP-binding regulatory protein BcsB [Pandoraea sputorum]